MTTQAIIEAPSRNGHVSKQSGELNTPYRELLPPLSTDEQAALRASIEREGVRDAIVVDEAGNILDGHHRYSIDKNAPRRVVEGLSEAEKKAFVFRSNFSRRNLSPDQKAEQRKKMKAIAQELNQAKWSQADIGAALGVSRETVSDWLIVPIGNSTNRNNPKPATRDVRVKVSKAAHAEIRDRAKTGETREQIAADFGVTHSAITKIIAKEEAKQEQEALQSEALPTDKFSVIYADPPWRYEHSVSDSRAIENQYPTMSLDEICALPVIGLAHDPCVLFMWATSPKLAESMKVIESWGFTYRTCAVWDKEVIGMGYYFRQQHELLLVGTKGYMPAPTPEDRPSSVIRSRRGKHSEKPEVVYDLIERMYPMTHRIELFARSKREGWATWGNQAN